VGRNQLTCLRSGFVQDIVVIYRSEIFLLFFFAFVQCAGIALIGLFKGIDFNMQVRFWFVPVVCLFVAVRAGTVGLARSLW
jgi:hypothetical protein